MTDLFSAGLLTEEPVVPEQDIQDESTAVVNQMLETIAKLADYISALDIANKVAMNRINQLTARLDSFERFLTILGRKDSDLGPIIKELEEKAAEKAVQPLEPTVEQKLAQEGSDETSS